jgi:stage V sporulation protein G
MQELLSVTASSVYPVKQPKGKLRAFARVILNDQIQLTSLRVYEGANGLFVSYPNDPNHKGDDYKQLYYPVTKDLREEIEGAVLEKLQSLEQALV